MIGKGSGGRGRGCLGQVTVEKNLAARSWMNKVQARELPLECRQLLGSDEHLQVRGPTPVKHLPDL